MQRGYDIIAPVYDKIAQLIYGNALHNAQTLYLPLIPPSSSILIAGGGTGRILEEITRIHQQDLYIDYIDISPKMIAKAKGRSTKSNKVNFINQSIFDWQADIDYDVIITPFFFDNFSEANMQKAFSLIHSSLRTNGFWLYTDFQISHPKAYWQRALLFTMYKFFRLTANIEAKQLPDVKSQFSLHNYQLVKEQLFFKQFITTCLFKKLIPDS